MTTDIDFRYAVKMANKNNRQIELSFNSINILKICVIIYTTVYPAMSE